MSRTNVHALQPALSHGCRSVMSEDKCGQKLPTITNRTKITSVYLECDADPFMKIQMKIIGSVVVAPNKIG
jgi:hypothetical protein